MADSPGSRPPSVQGPRPDAGRDRRLALRGVAQVSAATIVAELGQVSRFGRPDELQRHGAQRALQRRPDPPWRHTKTGNAHLRRIVIVPAPAGPGAGAPQAPATRQRGGESDRLEGQHRLVS